MTMALKQGLNPLYFGSLVPTAKMTYIVTIGEVLIPFISGLWFLPAYPLYPECPLRLNPLYFGSLVPTPRGHGKYGNTFVLIPFISGLWFLRPRQRQ